MFPDVQEKNGKLWIVFWGGPRRRQIGKTCPGRDMFPAQGQAPGAIATFYRRPQRAGPPRRLVCRIFEGRLELWRTALNCQKHVARVRRTVCPICSSPRRMQRAYRERTPDDTFFSEARRRTGQIKKTLRRWERRERTEEGQVRASEKGRQGTSCRAHFAAETSAQDPPKHFTQGPSAPTCICPALGCGKTFGSYPLSSGGALWAIRGCLRPAGRNLQMTGPRGGGGIAGQGFFHLY